jgi:hypothetical protein
VSKPLSVTFYPAKSAKGRTKPKPWQLVVGSELSGVLRISPAWDDDDPYRAWAMVMAMVDDFNAMHLTDGQVESMADQLRESFQKWRDANP